MAHYIDIWTTGDIAFDIVYDETDHPVVTLRVTTPAGSIVRGTMVLNGLHAQDLNANAVGAANLAVIAPGGDGKDGPRWHYH